MIKCSTEIIPIYKKGDKQDPKSYRKICLMNAIPKIADEIIRKRLIDWGITAKIGPQQFGFREGRDAASIGKFRQLKDLM